MLDYLSESEKLKVDQFVNDLVMREAVRKVILSGVYNDGILHKGEAADPLKNFMLGYFTQSAVQMFTTDEKGKKLEAIIHAVSMVESGFKELDKCKLVENEEKETINRAR